MNSYLIVSPVRAGSSWLNQVLANHYNLYNVGETLCKVSPGFEGQDTTGHIKLNNNSKTIFQFEDETHFKGRQPSKQYLENMTVIWNEKIRKLEPDEGLDYVASQGSCVAKFTPWDLYPDKGRGPGFGYGYSLDQLKKKWAPLTTIFLYRRNMVEHFLSFLAYHKTGIGNATSQYMHYQRPKAVYDNDWIDYHKIHFGVMEKCYWEHKFDHTIAYEDLFDMNELCGVPLKDYHGKFTFKLNKYSREEKDEVISRTGYNENFDITKHKVERQLWNTLI